MSMRTPTFLRRFRTATAILAVALIVATLIGVFPGPRPAEAHANLVSARPAPDAVLDESPTFIELMFSEQIAAAQSDIQVLDVNGDRVDLGDTAPVAGDPLSLKVSVEQLPDGAYTVLWSNLSTVDGHTLTGSYVFFVGSSDFAAPTAVAGEDDGSFPIAEPAVRWAILAGVASLAGSPWVFGLVLASTVNNDERRALRRTVERIAAAGGALVVAVGVLQLLLKLHETQSGLELLTETRWGMGWTLRTLFAALAAGAYALGPARLPASVRRGVIPAALGAALAVSLTSHGAAGEGYALVAGLVDAAHVLAAVAWGGGLVAFLMLARPARTDRASSEVLRAAIPRFSVVGGIATATLALTGMYAAWLNVGSVDAAATAYGRGVVLKVALLIVLIAVAGANTTWVRRRVAPPRGVGVGARWLRRLLSLEIALVVVVLLASALVTSLEPARQERAADERSAGVETTTEDAGLTITSTISPGAIGPNELRVRLSRNGDPYDNATAVELHYVNLEAALSTTTVELRRDGEGGWTLPQPAIITVDGVYEFRLRVQWPEGIDALQAVRFETGVDRSTSQLSPTTAWWAGILVLAGVGATMVAANAVGSRKRVVRGEVLGWTGAAIAAGAFLLWGRAPEAAASISNPIPATASSLARGADVYVLHCARCHGEEFDGTGAEAAGLPAQPANLVLHFPQHPDGQHFAVISNGRVQSGMPAWAGLLADEEIWDVINYLRIETEKRGPTLQVP